MDISKNNNIDLLYLTNPAIFQKYNKTLIKKKKNVEEIDFYKKRIFQLTKDLLRKKSINTLVDDSFENFVNICIDYLKFKDKRDIYQKEYQNLEDSKQNVSKDFDSKQNVHKDFDLKLTDQLITKKIIIEQKTVKELFNMKSKIKKSKIKLPKQKNVKIDGEEFRNKGVKEKSQ
jgi:hypothetical protein